MDAPIASPTQSSSTSTATISHFSLSGQQQPPQQGGLAADPKMAQGSADPFLRDFSLVAEAAKRAQVAVLVRDFEGCGL